MVRGLCSAGTHADHAFRDNDIPAATARRPRHR